MTSLRSRARVLTLLVCVFGLSLTMVGPAEAAATGTVMATTERMSGPGLPPTYTQNGTYARGAKLTLVCYRRGQAVSGYYGGSNNLWYKVSDGYYAADTDLNTGSSAPITPPCPTVWAPDTRDWYSFTPRLAQGLRVDVRGGKVANGTPVQQYAASASSAAQRFRFESVGGGYYRIVSRLSTSTSKQVIDVSGGSTASGAKVQTWSSASVNQQYWQLINLGNGYMNLKPKHATGKCLDVPNASTSQGVQLQIYTCNNTSAQQFKVTNLTPPIDRYKRWALDPKNWNATTDEGNPGVDTDGYPAGHAAQCADLGRAWSSWISRPVGFDGYDSSTTSKPGWHYVSGTMANARPGDVVTKVNGWRHVVVVLALPSGGKVSVLQQNPGSPAVASYATTTSGVIWRAN